MPYKILEVEIVGLVAADGVGLVAADAGSIDVPDTKLLFKMRVYLDGFGHGYLATTKDGNSIRYIGRNWRLLDKDFSTEDQFIIKEAIKRYVDEVTA